MARLALAPSACLARYLCASLPYHARGSSAIVARCLSHFGVFAIFFPHSARPGAWWPNARSSGFARLAFSGRLSSFAALPNEGATIRLRWLEWFVISDSARALVLSVLSLAQLARVLCGALVFPELRDLVSIRSLYECRLCHRQGWAFGRSYDRSDRPSFIFEDLFAFPLLASS